MGSGVCGSTNTVEDSEHDGDEKERKRKKSKSFEEQTHCVLSEMMDYEKTEPVVSLLEHSIGCGYRNDFIKNILYFSKQKVLVVQSDFQLRFWDVSETNKMNLVEILHMNIKPRIVRRRGVLEPHDVLRIRNSLQWDENTILVQYVDGYCTIYELNSFSRVKEFKLDTIFRKIYKLPLEVYLSSNNVFEGEDFDICNTEHHEKNIVTTTMIHRGLFLGVNVNTGFHLVSYHEGKEILTTSKFLDFDFRGENCVSKKHPNCIYMVVKKSENLEKNTQNKFTINRINFVTGVSEKEFQRVYYLDSCIISLSSFLNTFKDKEFLVVRNYNLQSVSILDTCEDHQISFFRTFNTFVFSSLVFRSMYIFLGQADGVLEWFDLRKFNWDEIITKTETKFRKRYLSRIPYLSSIEHIHLWKHGVNNLFLFIGSRENVRVLMVDNVDFHDSRNAKNWASLRVKKLQREDMKERIDFLVGGFCVDEGVNNTKGRSVRLKIMFDGFVDVKTLNIPKILLTL